MDHAPHNPFLAKKEMLIKPEELTSSPRQILSARLYYMVVWWQELQQAEAFFAVVLIIMNDVKIIIPGIGKTQ